jgi:hypothetical protein
VKSVKASVNLFEAVLGLPKPRRFMAMDIGTTNKGICTSNDTMEMKEMKEILRKNLPLPRTYTKDSVASQVILEVSFNLICD